MSTRDDKGAIVILTALVVVAMMVVVALVVDIGQLRVDRRTNKAAADVAARAGVGRLQFGPWSGVCKSRDFVLGNSPGFSSFDPGSETWTNVAEPPTVYGSDPCLGVASAPDPQPCVAGNPATWAKLQATAGGGRFTVEIQSGYAMPDSRFPEDFARAGDDSGTANGACDNLSVIITESRAPYFGGVVDAGDRLTRVRSVGRLNAEETLDFVAALQLLERSRCGVLVTGGANTRVIAQPFEDQPGTIQIDSAASAASCPQPTLSGQATSGGPSIVACSVQSANPECSPGTGDQSSRVGIYALNFNRPASYVTSSYPSTYGDTQAIATPRTGRRFVDERYRENVADLDAEAKSVTTLTLPPGCTSVLLNTCTGTDGTWYVLQGSACGSLALHTAQLLVAQRAWFNCDLNVNTPVVMEALNSYVVITGQLAVASTFTISDPRRVYIGGRATGNRIGVDIGNGGVLNVNTLGLAEPVSCALKDVIGDANRLVVGNGTFKAASGGTANLCHTFVYLAGGYDRVPTTDDTQPCTCDYGGKLDIGSGAFLGWTAPNDIRDRPPDSIDLLTSRFEDLALWTESGGAQGLAGGSSTSLAGVFFLPNADQFVLTGGGSLPIEFSAQFIARTMSVTGGAEINLTPRREDSVAVSVYRVLLVR